ncbi:MAG: SDR family NAD(P)-dependent oxidoreductase [Anaerolineales bacterium]|nr:SDR family NAD(P)-dependent oxidoreductase [Anaerolineales bacterium]
MSAAALPPVADNRGLSAEKRALLARRLRAASDAPQTLAGDPIAVIGLGCRFPGGANTPEAFWRLLHDGVDAISRVPAARWDAAALHDPDPAAPGKLTVQWGGFLDDVSGFDADFFGLAPREVERMDPQQRLFLEVAWDALESAGQTQTQLAGSATGVFVGVSTNDFQHLRLGDRQAIGPYDGSGTAHSIVANRLSYLLNLQGPSVAVDTACSSSLVAVHLACQSLRLAECDLAVAGGVNVILTPEPLIALSKAQMLAPDGRCKTFDARANGYARGEGCGVVVLKRLADALAANDAVLAVIRGSAVNQDGRTTGLTAPNGRAQQAVMRAALRNAGLAPAHISYVEAHGTGTSLGDPIEVEALTAVYGASPGPVYLGAVKSNVGHLEAAAGMAGLIKLVLALRHGVIPPNLHFQTLNPNITLAGTSFALPTTPQPWADVGPRRAAAISSFGFGGTNAHLILEDAPALPSPTAAASAEAAAAPVYVLPLSAHQPAALYQLAERYAEYLRAAPPLQAVVETAALRRTHHAYRFAAVGASAPDLADQLAEFARAAEAVPPVGEGRPAWVFTGQGAEDCRLPAAFLDRAPAFRAALAACDQALAAHLGWSVTDYVLGRLPGRDWRDTGVAQPVTFAVQVALAAQWRAWGLAPEAVAGHSVGEIAAAHVSGALTLADAAWLVAQRGRLMHTQHGQGRAASAQAAPAEAEAVARRSAGRVCVGAFNSPTSVIFSGEAAALAEVEAEWLAAGRFFRYLPVDYAFHSPAMQPVADELVRLAAHVTPQAAAVPFVSTVTGEFASGADLNAAYWGRNVAASVRFGAALATLLADGCDAFLELGPHPLLQRPMQQSVAARGAVATLTAALRQGQDPALTLRQALAALYRAGVPVDWARLYPVRQHPVALPPYPWQHTAFGVAPAAPRPLADAAEPGQHPFLGRRRHSPLNADVVFEARLDPQAVPLLLEHQLHGLAVAPAVVLLDLALSAAVRAGHPLPLALEGALIQSPLVIEPGVERVLQIVLQPEGADAARFLIYTGVVAAGAVTWTEHARGRVRWNVTDAPAPPVDLAALRAALPREVAPADLYAGFRARGLVHGARYQHLTALRVGADEALGRVEATLWPPADQCQLPPPLFESALQVVAAPLLARVSPESEAPHVPLALDRLVLYQRPGSALWSRARLTAPAAPNGAAPETYTASVALLGDDGAVLAQLEGLRLKRAAAAAVRRLAVRTAGARHDVYHLAWQAAPALAAPPPLPAGRYLLLAEDSEMAAALAARLAGPGRSVVRVRPGDVYSRPALDEYTVNLARPDDFTQLWQTAINPPGAACPAVLYLWPAPPIAEVGSLIGALHTAQMVARLAAPGTRLWLVGQEADPVSAGLFGLSSTFALEHGAQWGGFAQIAADLAPQAAAAALCATLAAGDEDHLALRGAGRFAARLRPLALPEAAAPAFRPDRTYLITGGFGALGQALARWLAEHGARHLAVVSRRSAAGPEAVSVRAFAADAADREALAGVLAAIEKDGPPLAGVFHLAGALDDGVLLQQTAARFEPVWAPKVRAAWHLHTLTTHLPLDYFVLFGSAAGVLGAAGQANYAAANAALDALAQHRHAQGLPALSVDWGVWAEAGMAARLAPADQARLAAYGLEPLAPDHALTLLGRLLAAPVAQALVFPVDWARFAQALHGWRGRSLLREALPAPAPGAAEAAAAAQAARARLLTLPAAERAAELQRQLEALVARVLGQPAGHRLDPQRGFFQLGLDSLMAMELQQRVQAQWGVSLPATAVFDYPSLERLAAYLNGLLQPMEAAPVAPEAPIDAALTAAVAEVQQLSDGELDALLAADED